MGAPQQSKQDRFTMHPTDEARPRNHVRRGALRILAALSALSVLATVAAALLVALSGPLLGGAGLGAREAAERFNELPEELITPPLPVKSEMVTETGEVVAELYEQNREDVALTEIAQVMQDAIVSIEDTRFYQHDGVDYQGVARAVLANSQAGEVEQGASTITQQYVKNALIQAARTKEEEAAASEQTVERKLREMRYALELEKETSKDEILRRYLNISYYGGGAYGVQAAAKRYYSTTAKDLTVAQAALLAGLVQSPSRYDPTKDEGAALARRNEVLDAMVRTGRLPAAEGEAAKAEPLALAPSEPRNGCEEATDPFYCDWVLGTLLADESLGKTPEERSAKVFTGGLTVTVAMDPKVQEAARSAAREAVPPSEQVAAAVAVVEPGTGKVKGLGVSKEYGEGPGQTKVNLAVGGSSGYQSGSTFKVFVLAAALEQGITPDLTLNSPAVYTSPVYKNNLEPYTVANAADSEDGLYNLVNGTWDSVNTYYIQLQERTGIEPAAQLAERLGVRQANGEPLQRFPSFTLGVNEVTPLAMAGAYAAFAADGKYCPPQGVLQITGPDGEEVERAEPECTQAMKPETARTVSAILRGVVEDGTGTKANIGRPAAGKTGTVQDYAAAWFAGYTPQLAAAVWVGDPRGGYSHPLRDVTINGQRYPQVYGGTIPAPIWAETMKRSLEGVPAAPLPAKLPSPGLPPGSPAP